MAWSEGIGARSSLAALVRLATALPPWVSLASLEAGILALFSVNRWILLLHWAALHLLLGSHRTSREGPRF